MSEEEQQPAEASDARGVRSRMLFGACLVFGGLIILALLGQVEARWLQGLPWSKAVRTPDYQIADPAAIPIWSWTLTPQQSVGDSALAQAVQEDILEKIAIKERAPERLKEESPVVALTSSDMLDASLLPRAHLVMFDRNAAFFESVLAEGRLPVPGRREVLAGPLLSDKPLQIGKATYQVVGRLHRHVSGFVKAFVMPADDALRAELDSATAQAIRGSVHLDGIGQIEELIPEIREKNFDALPLIYGGEAITRIDIAWGVWTCLLTIAIGAIICFMALFRALAAQNLGPFNAALRATVTYSAGLWGLYIFMFGGFFGAMAVGINDVEMNYLFTEFASHQFTEGGLKYVGDAYKSRNIPRAAHATFWNNFMVQTLLFGAAPSLFVLGLGVLKTLLTFVVVGFAMAPVWSGTATSMTYHGLTLALELPPYILAAFGMVVWALAVFKFLWAPVKTWYLGDKAAGAPIVYDAARQLPQALLVFAGTIVISGLLLYIAAWYEATTLILLH